MDKEFSSPFFYDDEAAKMGWNSLDSVNYSPGEENDAANASSLSQKGSR